MNLTADQLERLSAFVEGITDLANSTGVGLNVTTGALADITGTVLGTLGVDMITSAYVFIPVGV